MPIAFGYSRFNAHCAVDFARLHPNWMRISAEKFNEQGIAAQRIATIEIGTLGMGFVQRKRSFVIGQRFFKLGLAAQDVAHVAQCMRFSKWISVIGEKLCSTSVRVDGALNITITTSVVGLSGERIRFRVHA